jgi:hypothetical protein
MRACPRRSNANSFDGFPSRLPQDAGSEVLRRAGPFAVRPGSSEYLRTGVEWTHLRKDEEEFYGLFSGTLKPRRVEPCAFPRFAIILAPDARRFSAGNLAGDIHGRVGLGGLSAGPFWDSTCCGFLTMAGARGAIKYELVAASNLPARLSAAGFSSRRWMGTELSVCRER